MRCRGWKRGDGWMKMYLKEGGKGEMGGVKVEKGVNGGLREVGGEVGGRGVRGGGVGGRGIGGGGRGGWRCFLDGCG